MKKTLITLSAVLAAVFAGQAMAQDKTRAEVKKEAAAAEKAGTIEKGEGSKNPEGKSTKARAEVKKEAAAANKAGTDKEATSAPAAKSEKARADVKKEAAAAEKAGTIGKGEGPAATPAPAKK